MQHGPPKFTLLPDTELATGLSDSSKTRQVVLKVPSTVDLSIAQTALTITARGKKITKKDSFSFYFSVGRKIFSLLEDRAHH